MSREFHKVEGRKFNSGLFHIVAFLSVLTAGVTGIASGLIIVGSNVLEQFYAVYAILIALEAVILFVSAEKAKLVATSLLIIFYAYLLVFTLPYLRLTAFFVLALFVELREFSINFGIRSRKGIWLVAFGASITAMILISGLIRELGQVQTLGLLLASISDNITPGGTPTLFVGGIVFFTRYLVFSISIQSIMLFSALSFLLVENYFLIVGFVRKSTRSVVGGQVSGALTVLSCQCESISAAFPSIVSLILSAAVIPLILESIILVFLTNYLLRKRFVPGKSVRILDRIYPLNNSKFFTVISSLVIVGMPVLETTGVFLGWQYRLFFYGAINFIMFLAGVLAMILISGFRLLKISFRGSTVSILLVGISTVAMLLWFFPFFTSLALSNGIYFAMMSVITFCGGIIAGLAYTGVGGEGRRLFIEYLAMMFTMFAIVIFYISILSGYTIWPEFGFTEQVIFSIALWAVTLPLMWLATNLALNNSVSLEFRRYHA